MAAFTTVSDNEIKATIPYDSVPDGPICVLTPAGAAASLEAFTYLPSPPRIKYVLPQSGPAGSAVQIVGDHLDSVYRVTFNGIPAGKIIHYGFTGLWAVVPPGAGAGPLQVTNPAGTVSWIEPFTITERLWDSVDIGTLYSGLDFMDGSSLTVRGSGSGVSGASDSFRYVYTPASGDLDLWSQVIAWDGRSSPAAFGGLMVRKSTAPDAAYLAIYLTGSGEIRREWRSVDGGPVSSAATSSSFSLPVWLRLRKSGNKLSAYYTYDPRLVFIDEQVEIEFNNDYLYGMAVAAGKDGSYAQATFDIITNGGSPSGLFGMIGTTGSTALYSSCPGP